MTTLFWDVDTQHDFIAADGLLAVPGAEAIRPALAALTQHAHDNGLRIVATADDHDLGHAEISDAPDWKTTFPPHCMRGTRGQEKIAETALRNPLVVHAIHEDADAVSTRVRAHDGDILLCKPGTDIFRWNPNARTVLHALAPTRIVVYGVATDVCVVAAVDGLVRHAPECTLVVVADAMAALDTTRGEALVSEWRHKGISVVTSGEVIG